MELVPQSNEQAVSAAGFDYSALPEGEEVRATAERIKDRRYRIADGMIAIGRELISVKKILKRGQFQKWIAAEFDWSKATARNFMHVATNLGDKSTTIVLLPPTALYILAAPSFPDEARQEVFERLEQGEKFDADQIKQLGKNAKENVHTARDSAASAGPKETLASEPHTAVDVAPPSDSIGQDDAIPEEDQEMIARPEDPVSRVCDFANIIAKMPSPVEVARQIIADGHRLEDLPSFRSASDWLWAFCETLEEANLRSQGLKGAGKIPEAQRHTRFD